VDTIDRPDLKAQPVVDFRAIQLQHIGVAVQATMQEAFAHPELTDPSVVQRAVATLLGALQGEGDLDGWAAAGQAISEIGRIMSAAVEAGVPLDELLDEIRPIIGA